MLKIKDIHFFVTKNGKCYIKEWLQKLDIQIRGRINNRLVRLEYGVYGDYKHIKDNLYELRFFFGKGYRIYFLEKDNKIILLLNAGDKGTQSRDIKKAQEIIDILELENDYMEKFTNYLREQLENKAEVTEYVNAALEQYFLDRNKELFLSTLKEAIIASGGITKMSKDIHINRQHIYKILSSKGNPSFDNIGSLLTALGLQLKVESQPHHL